MGGGGGGGGGGGETSTQKLSGISTIYVHSDDASVD